MTTEPIQPVDNNILRLLIREAVERELANNLAPLRTQLQVQDGTLKQFNRDLIGMLGRVEDLDALVRGNPRQNLIGLAEQMKAQNSLLAELRNQVSEAVERVKEELAGEIHEIKQKQDDASRAREALINQWRGAKLALIGLAGVTSLPYLEMIGKLLHLMP